MLIDYHIYVLDDEEENEPRVDGKQNVQCQRNVRCTIVKFVTIWRYEKYLITDLQYWMDKQANRKPLIDKKKTNFNELIRKET